MTTIHKTKMSMETQTKRRIRAVWLGLLVSGLFLLWWSEFSSIGQRFEFWVSRQFYQPGVGFPLQNSDAFEFWWHTFPKRAVFLIPIWALGQIIYGLWLRKQAQWSARQREEWLRWVVLFVVGLLIPMFLVYLKKWTNQACPWSLSEFGGQLPYVHLFDPRPWPARSQACWPAGHVGVGLALLAVTFVGGWPRALWRNDAQLNKPRSRYLSAMAFAIYAVSLSMILGFSQVMRGAHFISHQFWSVWWAVVLAMILAHLKIIQPRWWWGTYLESNIEKKREID